MNSTLEEVVEETWANEDWMVPYLFFLLSIGTIGNSFGLILFRLYSMRKYSCSLYFSLMAIFDELSLIWWVTNRLTSHLTQIALRNQSTALCKLFVVVYYSSSQASIGMIVLAMFDRLYTTFKIAHGYFNSLVLTRRQHFQHICLGVYFFVLIALNSLLFGSQLIEAPENNEEYCVIIDPYFTRIYSIIDLCIYALIPCICMLVGDILILHYIRKSRARVTSISTINKRHETQLSIMLVITSIVSLFIVSPYSCLNLLINFSNIFNNDYRTLYTLNDAFGLLSTFTHAMHFYLFLMISSTIRKQFRSILNSAFATCSNGRNPFRSVIITPVKTTTSSQLTVNVVHRLPNEQMQ
ncbi:unnamed protein product [Adineta ricciae]|uniref:G-protein coupled receptors family 1 profile domain-containing protein n=1 Tax=Adineta ricciae TaxID=249248 RepID=A0A815TTI9_ADIRI|nr:unnamed protein product [Adineta ricciae]